MSPNILIVKLSAIGDVVHTLPALTALRRQYPQAKITWLVEEAAAPLIARHRALDRILISRRKRWIKGLCTRDRRRHFKEMIDFLRSLRDTRYDLVLDLQASLKGALLILLSRGKRKIGFGPGMEHQEHSYFVLNEKIPMVSMEVHALERGLRLLEAIGIPMRPIMYDLPIGDTEKTAAQTLLVSGGWRSKSDAIAINPMAKWETKLWSVEKFAETADRLIERFGVSLYFTGDHGDKEMIGTIQKSMRHPSVNLAGRTSLLELAAIYQQVACVITTDTGPMHIAAAVGTPVVALFGATAPWRTGPYGIGHKIIRVDQKCAPCFKRKCEEQLCMQRIEVKHVMDAVIELMEER